MPPGVMRNSASSPTLDALPLVTARSRATAFAAAALAAALAVGCTGGDAGPSLAKGASTGSDEIPKVPTPPADGPKLGALANITPVFDRPSAKGTQIGYLHAGAKVARAEEPYSKDGCEGGWYPIRPRGFVCAGETATTDLEHPTLVAMSLQPALEQSMPYTYARTRKETTIFERDPDRENAVRPVGKISRRSGMAIVGSWSALDHEGEMSRLGMLTNGKFIKAADLRAAEPSQFEGVDLMETGKLPTGFIVKRGVRAWHIEKGEAYKRKKFTYHQILSLSGRFRTIRGLKFWAFGDNQWARHRDVTIVRRRNAYPDFAKGDQKWIDVSIVTGSMVLYEGKRPIFASLVSIGVDRLGDPKESASTARGTFEVTAKHITAAGADVKNLANGVSIYDAPWAIELSSGQMIHGAFWHNRFGIEHGPGNIQLAPADAAKVWHWVDPGLPEGWHGAMRPADGTKTLVVVRK